VGKICDNLTYFRAKVLEKATELANLQEAMRELPEQSIESKKP